MWKKWVLMKMMAVYAAAFTMLGVAASQAMADRFGSQAVWRPSEAALNEIREKCLTLKTSEQISCIAGVIHRFGGSTEVIDFNRAMAGQAFMTKLEEIGRVDVAYVDFPFRADENQGSLLVNGDPPAVDVDDSQWIQQSLLEKNSTYTEIKKAFPNVTLWPGDRSPDGFLSLRKLEAGVQSFVFEYRLLDGCHACQFLGTAQIAFDFDSLGRFMDTDLVAVMRPSDTQEVRKAVKELRGAMPQSKFRELYRVSLGEEITISLESNPSTGYQWQIAKPFDSRVIELVRKEFRVSDNQLMGSGGLETWIFKTVGAGDTLLLLKYARPWEADVTPEKEAAFTIQVYEAR